MANARPLFVSPTLAPDASGTARTARRAPAPDPGVRSLDDLGTPLSQVTFCVLDLETTGTSPASCAITEIGAARFRGGEWLGSFQTLVNPGSEIPPSITVLTGITQAMVLPAPRIEAVLPSLVEFIGSAVIVGHNVRFDLGFVAEALRRTQRPPLQNPSVDTCALARRLVRDEVPNCRLSTLAERFRLSHRPAHRALDDALATADLLHLLLERAAGWGVLGLDDLLALPRAGGHPQAAKLRLTNDLPRSPGVYLFRDRADRVLYVGKAANLRQRVRSYFTGDERRKVGNLLREVHRIEHRPCHGPLEAAVAEVRLIHAHEPRYNRVANRWRSARYVKLTRERWPRLAVVTTPRADGGLYLGPLPSARQARLVVEALWDAVPLRRCSGPVPPPGRRRPAPCGPAQLGTAPCPCAGDADPERYAATVEALRACLEGDPAPLFTPLVARMHALAAAERYEEAATARDRAEALASALRRQRRLDRLRHAGRVRLGLPDGSLVELDGGLLVGRALPGEGDLGVPVGPPADPPPAEPPVLGLPAPRELADELTVVAAWYEQVAARARLLHADAGIAEPAFPLASFVPRPARQPAGDGR